jgi:hypothetical protein
MLKKAATQGAIKDLYNKLLDRLNKSLEDADKLMLQTQLP